MKTTERNRRNKIKGEIIARFGSIKEAAATLRVSDETIRNAIDGKSPKTAQRLVNFGITSLTA